MPNERTEEERVQEIIDELIMLRQIKRNLDRVYEVLKNEGSPLKDLVELILYGDDYKELREKNEC